MSPVYYLDAEITPARSLSRRGLNIVMGVTIAFALIPVTAFMAMGAHLVLPFVGLDVFGLWLAFHIMNRRVSAEIRRGSPPVRACNGRASSARAAPPGRAAR